MLNEFVQYTRCAELALEPLGTTLQRGRHSAENNGVLGDSGVVKPLAFTRQYTSDLIAQATSSDAAADMLKEIGRAIAMLRLERYVDNSISDDNLPGMKSLVRSGYYMLRPLLPVSFRKHLQRLALRDWDAIPFPQWPIDLTTERLIEATWRILLNLSGTNKLPFIWFWPEGYSSACIMTHDVETETGRDFCATMMKMEQRVGIHSAFEVIPEERYPVPDAFLQEIRDQGCEVCVHGLNHDGRLFSSEAMFLERARRINEYAERWGAKGFRSPVMYRNLDWLHKLHFSYDMSVPNVGHLDPQRGGCCTVMPYFIGEMLELPLTTIQDYSLFNILQQRSLDLWIKQTRTIQKKHGLITFIIHPDYVTEPWSSQIYERLLDRLSVLRADDSVWMALPRDVDNWWRARREMRLVREGGDWRIDGPQAERAKIAYAALDNGSVAYHF